MADVEPIRTEADYEAALARIDKLMDAEPGSPEGGELDVLVDLVDLYERRQEPMGYPDPVTAIEFRMEQAGLSPRDLIPFIGTRAKVSEVLSGKRSITMPMARALHEHLGIPADVLLRRPDRTPDRPLADLDWRRFPLKAMAKRGWVSEVPRTAARAAELMGKLIDDAGGERVASAALYRKTDTLRANAKADAHALKAWCLRALGTANRDRSRGDYTAGTVTPDFLRQVARLSWSQDGPRQAQEFLGGNGIPLVIVEHLPRTYLDGAALRLGDGRPVVALTLRYDRLDNFWFCLLHELAHVGRHIDNDDGHAFVDDLSLRTFDAGRQDPREAEADEWAEEALIPRATWEASAVRERPTPIAVLDLAQALHVHPAIVAGRVRHERRNYRLLSQFVGTGEVRRQFTDVGATADSGMGEAR